jgi:hypothetical protein
MVLYANLSSLSNDREIILTPLAIIFLQSSSCSGWKDVPEL